MKRGIIIGALPVLMALLFQCDKDDPLPNVHIPDDNFLNALIELGVDTDGDGLISLREAAMVTNLNVNYRRISDMSGIEAFTNLDTLNCEWNM